MWDDAILGRVLMLAPPEQWLKLSLDWLDDLQPAGVILFRRHLPDDLDEARAAIARLHAWAAERGETLLVAMDEEGGFVSQVTGFMPIPPSARALAQAGDPEITHEAFTRYGARIHALGVNLDFAPVCDINNNPRNPVIGVRSFGSDPHVVTRYARAAHQGLTQSGVLSCLKHYPGHGDTDLDSHLTLPVVSHSRDRFEAVELKPFRALLPEVPVVMVAHLACPGLGGEDLPATLSPQITTDLLRGELGFRGVAITDAMDMQGVAGQFDFDEAAVRALKAGCDLLLYCSEMEYPRQAREGLRKALASGRLPSTRFEQAIERVDHLRVLAAARGDMVDVSRPLPALDQDRTMYRELCREALLVENPLGWQAIGRAIHARGHLCLVGWNQEILQKLQRRFGSTLRTVEVRTPESLADSLDAPVVIVLAERLPLHDDTVAFLGAWSRFHPHSALANLLTPEVDIPIADLFTTRLRTADCSDAMLEVFCELCLTVGESSLS